MGTGTDAAEDRFRELFDAHRGVVLAYALRRVTVPADAADVLAETFVVAWRRLPDIPPGDELPWLVGVARHVLRNTRRGNVRRDRLADRLRADLSRLPTWVEPPVTGGQVGAALAMLPRADRELLQLIAWEGLSPAQLAVALGLPGPTVRTRLRRARERLRRAMELSQQTATGHDSTDEHPFVARRGER